MECFQPWSPLYETETLSRVVSKATIITQCNVHRDAWRAVSNGAPDTLHVTLILDVV